MSRVSPIQTRYAGHRFRSRTEARWAVFLDHIGLAWAYEPEGYHVAGHGLYLPDFYLPGLHGGVYLEVKPDSYSPRRDDVALWAAFSAGAAGPLILLTGTPSAARYIGTRLSGGGVEWTPYCFASTDNGPELFVAPSVSTANAYAPLAAIKAAREARFEHGETPVPPMTEWSLADTIASLKAKLHRAYYYGDEYLCDELHSALIEAEFADRRMAGRAE